MIFNFKKCMDNYQLTDTKKHVQFYCRRVIKGLKSFCTNIIPVHVNLKSTDVFYLLTETFIY